MSDLDIREQIAHYVAREIDAAALEDWLHDYAWKLEDSGGPLALQTLRLLAERGNGDWTDDELRDRLAALSRTYWLEHAPRLVYSGSIGHVIREDRQSPSVERLRVAESV